jgi:hypothetical protein
MIHARQADKNKIKTGGFGSIVEIMITTAVVGFAIFSFFMLLRSTHKEMYLSKEFIAASNAAGRILESIKGVPYDKFPITAAMTDIKNIPLFSDIAGGGSGLDDICEKMAIREQDGVKIIEVEISWRARGKENNAETGKIEFMLFKTLF